jgi:PhzF family phenazine biosynthesis protein
VAGVRLLTVDAFTDVPFAGNPAAVVFLDEAPSDEWMALVARETSVPDTAFVIRETSPDADFTIRWFTPTKEVDLCGHATLASAHCLLEDGVGGPIRFTSRSGLLTVERLGDGSLAMDFPAWPPTEIDATDAASAALAVPVKWTGAAHDGFFLLALVADERAVRDLVPESSAILALDFFAVIATAAAEPGQSHDFVSRLFAPKVGIPEDPVTGSSHTVLGPFWADRLGRTSLVGIQASSRPGRVGVNVLGDRVTITGRATTVLDGRLAAVAQP